MSYRMIARVPKGLREKQVTTSMLRCPVTGILLGSGYNAPRVSVRAIHDDRGHLVRQVMEWQHGLA